MRNVVLGGPITVQALGKIFTLPGTPEYEVIRLSKQERQALRRALAILGELRERIDPHETEDWEWEYPAVSCADTWLSEVIDIDQFRVMEAPLVVAPKGDPS
jgi:hypothetical protein